MKKCVYLLFLSVLCFSCINKTEESISLCTGDKTCWNKQGNVTTSKEEMVLSGNKAKAISTKAFKNFVLEFECKTEEGAKGAVYFHSDGYSKKQIGHKITINNNVNQHAWSEPKTGSLEDIIVVPDVIAANNGWFPVKIEVAANNVQIYIGDLLTVDYIESSDNVSTSKKRKPLSEGVFVFANFDDPAISFRNIRIKVLDDFLPKKEISTIEVIQETPLENSEESGSQDNGILPDN